jgi:hypothetical protein
MSSLTFDERRWLKQQIDSQTRTRLAHPHPKTDKQLARLSGGHRRFNGRSASARMTLTR